MTVGERIKRARERRGLSQKDLAVKLEISKANMCRYENGERTPRIDAIKRIAAALGCDVMELIEDPKENGGVFMSNYVEVCGRKVPVDAEKLARVKELLGMASVRLADIPAGGTFLIGNHEMVVLEKIGGAAAVIRKDLLKESKFGRNNNFDGSAVDGICREFAEEMEAAVGEDNLLEHTVDLTSDDGLKDYGTVERKASLLTAEQYRKYVEILDQHNPKKWWWLATPYSTPRHHGDSWVKCVVPSGYLYIGSNYGDCGVRPFCILNSNIFVSM